MWNTKTATSFFLLLTLYPTSFDCGRISASQQLVDTWLGQMPAGSVAAAVISPEETEYFFAGHTLAGDPLFPDENTVFEIGSITKGFTGLLLADQILSRNVFLNDTLAKLLTDWPGRFSAPAGNITLLELATHSSGLPREPDNMTPAPLPDNPFANYTVEKLYRWLDKAQLVNRGSMLYSNAGVGILGHALEVKRGQIYQDFLKERVLNPLGLRDTTITLNSDQKRRLFPGHGLKGEIVSNLEFDVLAPAGALRSTLSDLVHFVRLATGVEDMPKELREAFELATKPRQKPTVDSRAIGLCWPSSLLPHDTLLTWHNGNTFGYHAYVGWVPETQVGVAVATSVTSDPNDSTDNLALSLLKLKLRL